MTIKVLDYLCPAEPGSRSWITGAFKSTSLNTRHRRFFNLKKIVIYCSIYIFYAFKALLFLVVFLFFLEIVRCFFIIGT